MFTSYWSLLIALSNSVIFTVIYPHTISSVGFIPLFLWSSLTLSPWHPLEACVLLWWTVGKNRSDGQADPRLMPAGRNIGRNIKILILHCFRRSGRVQQWAELKCRPRSVSQSAIRRFTRFVYACMREWAGSVMGEQGGTLSA